MGIFKRITSFAVSAALFIALVPSSVFAHDGDHKIYKGSFIYYDKATESDLNADFYFSDAYFARPSTQMDEHLRTMSLSLSLASVDKTKQGTIFDILRNTGFDSDTVREDEMEKQSKDTIGTIMANKTTDDGKKLVVVVFNGMRYGAEWESNLTVGATGDAEGFSKAAKKAYDRLLNYEKDNGLKGAKLWITGYSRGGAVADMTGKLVNENLDELGITENDLYDYTFATPRASEKALGYKNIYDIVDPYDIIPRLLLQGWGIERAGTEYVIPCEKQTLQPKTINLFAGFKIEDKTVDGKPAEPIDAKKFLDDFSKLLSDNITREAYDAERDSLPPFITKLITDNREYTILDFLKESFKGFGLSSPLLPPILTLLTTDPESEAYIKAMQDLPQIVSDFFDASEGKDKISAEDLALVKKAVPAAVRVFIAPIKADFSSMFEKSATLGGNITQIITNHFSSSYFTKVSALDCYYTKKSVDPGKLRYFVMDFNDGDFEAMEKFGVPKSDIDLVKNGYDVIYQTNYEVFEDKDIKQEDKDAVAKLLGKAPDMAFYFKSTPTRTQTSGKTETTELEEGFTLKLAIVPDKDEKIGTDGDYYLVSYKDGKAEKCKATFEFDDNGRLTMTYPYKKDTMNAIVYLENKFQRIAGDNRFITAVEISKASYEQSENVVLAYGLNYADALAGVPLANKLEAPILLSAKDSLPDVTLAEIKRLGAKNVYILGGTNAISENVEKQLKDNKLTTERIAGETRFGTASAIAEKLNEKPEDVFFVYGLNYADALSASTAAALKKAPIIYLTSNGDLNTDTASYLEKLKKAGTVKNAYVIGGTGVISDDMAKKAANALGLEKATRVAGENRFLTCVAVNEQFKDLLNGTRLCVATGMDFPDALAGGAFAAKKKAPLFLVNGKAATPTLIDGQKSFLENKKASSLTVFGGTGAVSDDYIKDITKYIV